MERERIKALRSEFHEVMENLQRAESLDARLVLLRQLREIINETNQIIQQSQQRMRAMRAKLRLR
jgi:hypothetical protein